jgi:hypothetical protein
LSSPFLGLTLALAACSGGSKDLSAESVGAVAVSGSGVTVDVLPTNSWSGGFTGAVRITDTAFASPITAFEITFTLGGTASVVGSAWNGNITAADTAGSRTATNPDWLPFQPIQIGQIWDVGFSGSGAFAGATIVSVKINGATIATGNADNDGISRSISALPFIDATSNAELLGELLREPTALGETTALQVRLPQPANASLAGSLVRVVGDVNNPHVLFRSDALVQLGLLGTSPGPDFFTAFATLPPQELATLKANQDIIARGSFGPTTTESVLFSSRSATSRTSFPPIDPSRFLPGNPIPINHCSIRPASTLQAWGQALFITSPSVVLDAARTWDPCSGAGTQGGVWTFAHLIREMANGSGKTPEDFVKDWLSLWLNTYTVNGDTVPARPLMFTQVIQPWATASGVVATLITDPDGFRHVNLTGPLNLNIAPYRLEAIVNRIDLGTTTHGGGTYGGVTGSPVTAGELRFIFGVVQPDPWGAGNDGTCGKKLFTTIFEYGVPGTGCGAVVSWAKQWTQLQASPGFTAAYLTLLQSMTESVVLHGAAPAKGNQNAINQVRTNEAELQSPQWELREFTLTNEQPGIPGSDSPANGELRAHTVALTPDDARFSFLGADPVVNQFVNSSVTCGSSFTMPFFFGGPPPVAFRGGNAFSGPPGGPNAWLANTVVATPNGICARHTFSLNTCQGCHRADSGTTGLSGSTNFTHIDPRSTIPVTLSKFLTGGGPGLTFNVNDTQFGAPAWPFADLDRRLQRLFDLSHCTSCITILPMVPNLVDVMQTLGPIPVDVNPADFPELRVGPITDLATVRKILDLRSQFADAKRDEPVDVIRSVSTATD